MTPMELAAVASAAVPGLNLTACASDPDDAADFDAAMLLDADRKRWRVRSPKHPEASTRLETELLVLSAFSLPVFMVVEARLSVHAPQPATLAAAIGWLGLCAITTTGIAGSAVPGAVVRSSSGFRRTSSPHAA